MEKNRYRITSFGNEYSRTKRERVKIKAISLPKVLLCPAKEFQRPISEEIGLLTGYVYVVVACDLSKLGPSPRNKCGT